MQANNKHGKEAYSISEVQKICSIGRTKIYELINNGTLPARKLDKRTFILRSDIETFLNNLEQYPVRDGCNV